VTPRSGTLVVNIGEILELVSDGYFRATLHRVITPPARRERISAAFFLGARLDATVLPTRRCWTTLRLLPGLRFSGILLRLSFSLLQIWQDFAQWQDATVEE
jgi:hypothetical protein